MNSNEFKFLFLFLFLFLFFVFKLIERCLGDRGVFIFFAAAMIVGSGVALIKVLEVFLDRHSGGE